MNTRSRVLREDKVLLTERPGEAPAPVPFFADSAWDSLGWFGLALAVIGCGQVLLAFFPAGGLGTPEGEAAAVARALASLPLLTIGLAALVASAMALKRPSTLTTLSIVLLTAALVVCGLLMRFWAVAPLVFHPAPGPAAEAFRQTVAQTRFLGGAFALLYAAMAAYALQHAALARRHFM